MVILFPSSLGNPEIHPPACPGVLPGHHPGLIEFVCAANIVIAHFQRDIFSERTTRLPS
jgi:hypothetical protein